MQHTSREPDACVRDAACHRQRLQVVQRVRDLLVHCALAVLELALDRKRLLTVVADTQDVDAAVLGDDRLADTDFPIRLQSSRLEAPGDVQRHQVRVIRTRHLRLLRAPLRQPRRNGLAIRATFHARPTESRRSACIGSPLSEAAGAVPWPPASRSRRAAICTASGFKSLPRKRRPSLAAATPTLPDPMNGSTTT